MIQKFRRKISISQLIRKPEKYSCPEDIQKDFFMNDFQGFCLTKIFQFISRVEVERLREKWKIHWVIDKFNLNIFLWLKSFVVRTSSMADIDWLTVLMDDPQMDKKDHWKEKLEIKSKRKDRKSMNFLCRKFMNGKFEENLFNPNRWF